MQGEPDNISGLQGSGATPLTPGDPHRIGAFRLRGVLGSGGMGRVYLGTAEGRYAAVKRVLPALAEDEDFLRHFGHELDNLARLPGGVSAKLLASDRTATPPWFATEYIPGITLSEAVRLHGGALPADSMWRLLRDASAGLRKVHAAEMVHRDLKPSNVMLTTGGAVLIDFGVARAADQSRLTKTGMVIGTPAYMAPEQAVAGKQITGAADVFALGSLLLYAANGRPPFGDGSGLELLYRIVHEEPDMGDLAEAVPGLAEIVTRCLAKDPADRPTAQELYDLAGDHTLPLTPASPAPWPRQVAERIAERAAFAARSPEDAFGPEAEEDDEPAVVPPPPVGPPTPGTPPAKKPRERRRRTMLLVLPIVVVTGTTLTVALSPYEIPGLGKDPGVSAKPSPTPSGSASSAPSPDGVSPSPSRPGASPAGSASPSTDAPGGVPGDGGAGGAGAGGSGGGQDPGASDGGGGNGSGGSSSSGGSGASGGSGSGGGGQAPAPPPAPSTSARLKNLALGRCVTENKNTFSGSSSVMNAVCGEPGANGTQRYYTWTYQPVSATAFKLVGETGKCLKSNAFYGLAVEACNGSEAQLWQIGAQGAGGHTLKSRADGMCLAMTSNVGFAKAACDATQQSQLWAG